MKIRIGYLDLKVCCPVSGQDVILRYVDNSLYEIYSKAYPDAFESDTKNVNTKNVDIIPDAE